MILGRHDTDTLLTKYWIGQVLYDQQKYSEAEGLLRQAADGQESKLGRDDTDTLNSKYWLGRALYGQKKYGEAEKLFRQVANGQERTLGRDHKDTLATLRLLQELHLDPHPPPLPTNNTSQHALASRLSNFFLERQDNQQPYTDSEINEISTLLMHSNQRWGKVPRTYAVLRTIGYVNLLDELIDAGFSDYWFPVTERSLPGCLLPSVQTSFVRAQSLVLTKSVNLEKGEKGQHCYYQKGESPPFETKGVLGRGGFGQVDRVLSLISFKEYARKRVPRGLAFRGRKIEDIKLFITEIEILKRIKHHHIVELIGSYTDSRYMALVMSPVADMDLGTYLTRATISNHPELRTFFGCLATALEYLHQHKVRHKDIKPGNILVARGNILFTDFGLSRDFTDANSSTTMSMVNGMTPRYCAPEVAQYQPRNTASDIWSLGVVFMEMIVVLKGRTAQYMEEFFTQHGSQHAFIRTNPAALSEFVAELEGAGELYDNRALGWTQQMLSVERQLRPTATSLVVSITAISHEGKGTGFCGICCISPEEEFSDWADE
jgi:tetratricopeptide (TPR) repeat protein